MHDYFKDTLLYRIETSYFEEVYNTLTFKNFDMNVKTRGYVTIIVLYLIFYSSNFFSEKSSIPLI